MPTSAVRLFRIAALMSSFVRPRSNPTISYERSSTPKELRLIAQGCERSSLPWAHDVRRYLPRMGLRHLIARVSLQTRSSGSSNRPLIPPAKSGCWEPPRLTLGSEVLKIELIFFRKNEGYFQAVLQLCGVGMKYLEPHPMNGRGLYLSLIRDDVRPGRKHH